MDITWDPREERPPDAESLEAEIRRLAPNARVKLTLRDGAWLVRALGAAAMCSRGPALAERDLSATIAEMLNDNDCAARVR